jgi:hypothetical protein
LNSKRRTKYIQINWKKKWKEFTLESVQKLWKTYKEIKIPISTTTPFSYDKHNQEKPKEFDSFNRIALILDVQAKPASQDEYKDYNIAESYDPGTKKVFAWWYQNTQKQRWLRLSFITIDILSIPAMNNELERIFSGARRTVN